MEAPIIAFMPYMVGRRFDFWNVSLDALDYPLGQPTELLGKSLKVRNLKPKDHLIVYPSKSIFYAPKFLCRANISVMIVEPDLVHQRYLNLATKKFSRFFRVLSKNQKLLSEIPNGNHFVFGSSFIENPEKLIIKKSQDCSLIASSKNEFIGHKMRHEIAGMIKQDNLPIDVIGRGYKPFQKKEDGLLPYKYSAVIENCQEVGYFTEKLIDSFLCETIPIYWGAQDITNYFDEDGMLVCNSKEEVAEAMRRVGEMKLHENCRAIKENKARAFYYADISARAAQIISDELNIQAKR